MASVTTAPINAVVAHIMQEKQGEYGPYQSVLFESPDLQDGKLWRAMNSDEAQQLHKGQAVELTPTKTSKGKDGWNIRPLDELTQPHQAAPTPRPQKPMTQAQSTGLSAQQNQSSEPPVSLTVAEKREQIESYAFLMANLHAVCYQAAEQAYAGQNAPDEVIRAATSSVFIATERRFRLASPGS